MEPEETIAADDANPPTIIVVGNEKGGTGKSTTALHLAIGLLYRGLSVGTLDLDTRQATLTRYLRNRERSVEADWGLPFPHHRGLEEIDPASPEEAEEEARRQIGAALGDLGHCDVIVVDTPGSPTPLSRLGHEEADILITPINDSLLDIDVLAEIDPVNRTAVSPSFYCRMAWEYHNRRIVEGRTPIDWIVIRNRAPHIHSRNRRDVDAILQKLSQRIGFRLAPGLSERVVFRELFLKGLTVLDLPQTGGMRSDSPTHRSARDEVDALLQSIAIRPRTGMQRNFAATA